MYSQTYAVKTTGSKCHDEAVSREAFFQCGNHCYSGEILLGFQQAFGDLTLKEIPTLIPLVQRQQDSLSYLCDTSNIPTTSKFFEPVKQMEKWRHFVLKEVTSPSISTQMAQLAAKHSWINDDESMVYFELVGNASLLFNDIMFIANRSYSKGLVCVTIYFEGEALLW